jgi:hypothetical protein
VPTRIVFIGGETMTVSEDVNEIVDLLSHARPVRCVRVVNGAPREAHFVPTNVLYVEQASE